MGSTTATNVGRTGTGLTRRGALRTLVVGAGAALVTTAFGTTPQPTPPRPTEVPLRLGSSTAAYQTKDVDYLEVDGKTFQATVYQPSGPGPFPALLAVHEGFWTAGARSDQAPIAQALAAYGVLVVAIDFRQDRQYHFPDPVADVNFAVRWLRAHAREFNASPKVVGALGSSSGGHLVMLNALRPDDPRYSSVPLAGTTARAASPDYVIGHSPILDPPAWRAFAEQASKVDVVQLMDAFFTPPQTIHDANPYLIVERREQVALPPTLVVQGTEDIYIDHRNQDSFAAAYREAGGTLQLEKFQGAPHVFMNSVGANTEEALGIIRDFIGRQMT